MEQILGLYINLYATLALLIVLAILAVKKDFYSFSGKLFRQLIVLNIILLLAEGIAFAVDSVDTSASYFWNYWLNVLLFILSPLICAYFGAYIDFKLFHSFERFKSKVFYWIPFALGVIFIIINFFKPILFKLSSDNVYTRGVFFYVIAIIIFSYFGYFLLSTIKERKNIDRSVFWGLTLLVTFPLMGGAIQALNYGSMSMYSMMALGIFSAYISIETINSSKDYLTKLFTRSKAVDFIDNLITKKSDFAVVMIDIDNFKDINDEFGHSIGDLVLFDFGKLLLKVFEDDTLVSRFGGDEFVVICKTCSEELLMTAKQRLKDELVNYNKQFKVEFSYGYSFYKKTSSSSKSEILVEADHNMYKDKAINKNYKRRESDR